MLVLGIESSCDETAVAIYSDQDGLLAHELYSQIEIHARFGGVVPELASRDHIRKLIPLLDKCFKNAGVKPKELDAIAYTAGPGLVGALLVGGTIAQGLAFGWGIPAIPIHHMEAHLLAALLDKPNIKIPFVALLVSGGHSMLVDVKEPGVYKILGQTLDDAAGEAFDKTAKLLGLPYPGGPAIADLAKKGSGSFDFPRPMIKKPGLDFSFSGLKTAVLLTVRDLERQGSLNESNRADIAYSFQEAIVETLVVKSLRALEFTGYSSLVVAGGVGANHTLRTTLKSALIEKGAEVHYPSPDLCTDNGAMIAFAGFNRISSLKVNGRKVVARARWDLDELPPIHH
ncbi:MAG: tRNA (adenosine(37)-N6)-threonylcarbamoyltransferase complex transferase subunit TsaD [Pseudomonadota bacterium]|nr:tRNA (adenosine(37)-N6)-threonylcarbamoyltransferase complex transferase subunit TsaD [Pseudomonadota bacterium]